MKTPVDIWIICALPEERDAVRRVLHRRSRQKFVDDVGQSGLAFLAGTAFGSDGLPLSVHLSCAGGYAGLELALRDLRARKVAPKTIRTYTQAVDLFERFLHETGMPTTPLQHSRSRGP